ncbi:MAG: methyltransferase domain-containing protein [Myxococcaceae bacterium]
MTIEKSTVRDYSGERYEPEQANALAHADHHARYHFVRRSFSGGRLLDVGCGLGIGAAFLADSFSHTHGIDASVEAIAVARRTRGTSRLSFSTVEEFRASGGGQFDVVTCLEVIEHTLAQRELLELLKASVDQHGVAIISTPNRDWTQRKGLHNPFHVKELNADEFFKLVRSVFPHVHQWSQLQVQGGIVTQEASAQSVSTAFSGRYAIDAPFELSDVTNFVAVCSMLPRAAAEAISVLDASCTYQLELEAIIQKNEEMIDERDKLLRRQDAAIAKLNDELSAALRAREILNAQVRRLQRLEEPPDSDAMPLRWRIADRVNAALKTTPVHRLIKKALSKR